MENDLPGMGKGDKVKLALARQVRRETTMKTELDAAASALGAWPRVSNLYMKNENIKYLPMVRNEKGMRRSFRILCLLPLALLAAGCLNPRPASKPPTPYYDRFLSIIDTNDLMWRHLTSPLLVDTNNTMPTFTISPISLKKALASGEVAGVRLGMSMDEVVALWGKPRDVWWHCGGAPCLGFNEMALDFEANRVVDIHIFTGEKYHFEEGVSEESRAEDWIRVLGEPTRPYDLPLSHSFTLSYETEKATLWLWLWHTGYLIELHIQVPNPKSVKASSPES
jgi:hypothetical protein